MEIPKDAVVPLAAAAGAIIGAVTNFIGSLLTSRWTSERESHRLRTEYEAKHRTQLITKQIAACEEIWGALRLASKRKGAEQVVVWNGSSASISAKHAKELYLSLINIFNTPTGLYLSHDVRQKLWPVLDILEEKLAPEICGRSERSDVSKNTISSFWGCVAELRNALRRELGVEDLKVTREEPVTQSHSSSKQSS
jgi:hypothetical protein